jgi:hypothetical protein
MRTYQLDLGLAALCHWPMPLPPLSSWWHHSVPASTPPQPLATPLHHHDHHSLWPRHATPLPHALEWPPSPSPNRLTYRPMEPSDPDASPWGCRGQSCAVHGWGLALTGLHWPTGLRHRAVNRRKREKEKKMTTVASR